LGNNIIVDGVHWTFSPGLQLKTFLRNRRKTIKKGKNRL